MSKLKKGLFFLVVLILVGCQTAPTTEPEAAAVEGEKLEFCVVHNMKDHVSIALIWDGMLDEAKNYNVELTDFDPAFDPEKQASMIEDCIARKPDAILVNAVDPTAVVASLKKAHDAGIPVIMHNADCAEEGHQYTESYVSQDSRSQGYAAGTLMAQDLGGEGNVVLLTGKPGQTDVIWRSEGLYRAWDDADANFIVIAEQPADWDRDKGMTTMQYILTQNEDIDAVFAMCDCMAMGAFQAIKAAGREDEIAVYGVGVYEAEACDMVKSGDITGSSVQNSYGIGVNAVRAAYDYIQGRVVPEEWLVTTAAVTSENVDKWCVAPDWTP